MTAVARCLERVADALGRGEAPAVELALLALHALDGLVETRLLILGECHQ
jgi:hypothetical protein